MRLHHLEMTAFGPFSGTERVDFDALSDAGLFLLCGPTGAGKTSVLDAVCFALYGEVPGDRNCAKRLRSDHAPPGTPSKVVLEVSINSRRFRISRSPAWQRAKRRGSGTTTEQSRVNLEELVENCWVHHSNRLDETGHLLTGLLGMTVTQFCQVAMLPQGRFQSFLRARSDDRHKVLQQLFRTSRFESVERWLVAQRKELHSADRLHKEAVASVVSRISEAGAAEVPKRWELHDLAVAADQGGVAAWAEDVLETVMTDRRRVEADVAKVTERAQEARSALHHAEQTARLRADHAKALETRTALEATQQVADVDRRELDAARRAASVAPLMKVSTQARVDAERAELDLSDALAEAASMLRAEPDSLTPTDLATAEEQARQVATIARALLPREQELEQARRTVAETTARLEELTDGFTGLEERCAAVPAELAALRPVLASRSATAAAADRLEEQEGRLLAQLAAAERLERLLVEVEQARRHHRISLDAAHSLRERMHDIREARINGMAAELAAVLASGDECPVCGSAEHPAVARTVQGSPTRADEEAARSAYEDAEFTRQANAEAVKTLEQSIALARQASVDKSPPALASELADLREQRVECRRAAAERHSLESRIVQLEKELLAAQERAKQVGADIARLAQRRDHARAVAEATSNELSQLFGREDMSESIAGLIEGKAAAGVVFARARNALNRRDLAFARCSEALEDVLGCAREHGFDSVEEAASAQLAPEEMVGREERLQQRATQWAHAATTLSDAEVQAAVAPGVPDAATQQHAVESLEAMVANLTARWRNLQRQENRLRTLTEELSHVLDAWRPTRTAYSLAQSLSTLVEGKGGDNTLQMRLSAYVLAERLRQVVAAANERLSAMTDQRYLLEHSVSRGVGEVRGGLSLMVRDEWTGESRDPVTLSGGETFLVSLALALGLADVVTHEAGGSNIDTLFIDEGFGTLDPDTLDDVMSTLDGLRDGGRVVGIVSHVPEMRTRVTSQLRILKDRSGSRVAMTREVV